jgi:hypothetical protein
VKANEVFTAFGICAHHVQGFESDLLTLVLVVAQITGEAVTTAELKDMENERRTMGQLLKRFSTVSNPRIHLPQGWDVALDRRNYLFHRFFYEKAFSLYTKAGCELLVKELEEMTTMFEKAGWSARALVDQLVENLGISPEAS